MRQWTRGSSICWVIFCGFLLVVGFLIGFRLVGPAFWPHEDTIPSGWVRSEELGCPDGRPIVGCWIDDQGQPITIPVVEVGGRWYGYDTHAGHPLELLYGYPPMWWTDLPGGAR
jgi:hypothetical protein